MRVGFNYKYVSLAALAIATMSGPSAAAEVENDQPSGGSAIADIIVTAQGRQQRLQDVPVSVSVVSGDQLEQQGIRTLQDVSSRVANVRITTGSLVNSINVRGVGSGENPGFEQAVATFADGVYRSRSRTTMSALFDVDRVEILKGPQTTFFGANASAGALSITTRKPGDVFEYNASGLYGLSDGEYNFEGGVTMPISATLSGRAAVRVSGMEGFVDLPGGKNGPHDNSVQGRLSLRWQPTANWTTDLRVDRARSRIDDYAPFQMTNCPASGGFPASSVCESILAANADFEDKLDYNSQSLPSYSHFDFFETALTNNFDVGPGTIRTITAYSDMKVKQRQPLIPVNYPTLSGYEPFPIEAKEKYKFFSQEVRFESKSGGTFEYAFGGYYQHGKLDYDTQAGFFFNPGPFPSFPALIETVFGDYPDFDPSYALTGAPFSQQRENTWSAFASLTIRPVERVRINLGGRYTDVTKKAHRYLVIGSTENAVAETLVPYTSATPDGQLPLPVAACIIMGCTLGDFATNKVHDNKFMPSVGLQFDATDDVMLYATYSKGFKAGGFSTSSSPSVFGPEVVDAYEIGMKGSFFDRALTLNIAAFRMDYKGLQETTFDSNLASSITNAAGARSQGIEVGAGWRIAEGVRFSADLAYLDAKYTDYANGECTKLSQYALSGNPDNPAETVCEAGGGIQDLSGKRRAYAAKWSGSVGLDFTVPAGDNEFRVSPVVNFSSAYFMTATADDLFRQKAFQKYDLRLGYGPADRRWELAVIGRNLTNVATTSYRLGVPGADGSVLNLVERGRSVGIQLTVKN